MSASDGFVVQEEKPPPSAPAISTEGANAAAHFHRGNNNVWPNVKPFVNGFLTGQISAAQLYCLYWCYKKLLPLTEEFSHPRQVAMEKRLLNTLKRQIPVTFLYRATYTTAQFGSFDFLTKKVEAANHGIPLTLYQEACCGLIAGGIAYCISHPLRVAYASIQAGSSQLPEPKFNLRSFLFPLYLKARNEGLLALWKGSGHSVTRDMCLNMGLLTSYNRSCSYFRESVGMRNTEAQLGAGIVSAFFAAACSFPYVHIAAIKDVMLSDGGKKSSFGNFLFVVSRVFRPGGEFKLYSGIARQFISFTPFIVAQRMILEAIREFEESVGY